MAPIVVTNVVPMQEGHVHVYVSTACLHGKHRKCGVRQLARGDLGPPHCQHCDSVCACPVCDHLTQAEQEAPGHAAARRVREHAARRGPVIA